MPKSRGDMVGALKDENNHVKETTAWTLGRILECQHGVITQKNLPFIVAVLLERIKDTPNIAEKVCGAIFHLAQGYGDSAGQASSPLSPFSQSIAQALLATTEREDSENSRLRTVAYEALNEVIIRVSAEDTATYLTQLVPVIMHKLNLTLEMTDREDQSELCDVLQVLIQNLRATEIPKCADKMMGLFLNVLACRPTTAHEGAMLAIGALVQKTGAEFAIYMPEFSRYLELGLRNFEEYHVCKVTAGVLTDICYALEDQNQAVLPYCDRIMIHLLEALASTQLHRSVKPSILACFHDIAHAIGEHFERYLSPTMQRRQAAVESSTQLVGDDEIVDYNDELRTGILQAYSSTFLGLGENKAALMAPYAGHMLEFVANVYQDKDRDEAVTKAALEVMVELVDKLGGNDVLAFLQRTVFWKNLLDECISSDDRQLKQTAEWFHALIERRFSG